MKTHKQLPPIQLRHRRNYSLPHMECSDFESKFLIESLCMQCMYAASDLAGTMKLQYDVTSRIIRMPCTARLDINFILKALQEGADGVLIVGCHPGDCAYKTGNLGAERRVRFARKLVAQLGLDENRVKMVFVSAAEGNKFAAEVNKFADEIRKIGPNPIRL